MSRNPATVRALKHRTFGSRVTLADEFAIPAPAYHGGRAVRWAWRHKRGAGVTVLVVGLWARTGSLVVALLLTAFVFAGVLTAWVAWQQRGGEAAALGPRDLLEVERQKARLTRQWDMACESAGLVGRGRGGGIPGLKRVRADAYGTLTATVRAGDSGVPVPQIQKATDTLAEIIGCREVVVTQTGPGVADLAFHWRDPIGRALPLADLPVAPKGYLAYGIRQDGGVATIRATQSVLIGGLTRMGKSNTVWALLADALRQDIPVDLYVSDPKGGVELDAFEALVGAEVTGLLRVREYAKTPAATVKMIERVESAMHCRQDWMKANGVRKVTPDRTNPLVVLILDETLPLTDLLKKGTDSALGRIGYTGAAAAYVVWANTQVAQVDSIGRFRDLIPQRICFATPNPQVTDSVLGQGSEAVGARCSDIREAGVGYSHSEGDRHPRKFRAAFVSDAETRAIAGGQLPKNVVDKARELYDLAAESETRADKPRTTALYRWFFADAPEGSPPAYIGISYDVLQRESQHNAALREFMCGDVRRTVEYYPTRKAALAAEKRAIETENPRYNVQHSRNPKRLRELRALRRDKAAA